MFSCRSFWKWCKLCKTLFEVSAKLSMFKLRESNIFVGPASWVNCRRWKMAWVKKGKITISFAFSFHLAQKYSPQQHLIWEANSLPRRKRWASRELRLQVWRRNISITGFLIGRKWWVSEELFLQVWRRNCFFALPLA